MSASEGGELVARAGVEVDPVVDESVAQGLGLAPEAVGQVDDEGPEDRREGGAIEGLTVELAAPGDVEEELGAGEGGGPGLTPAADAPPRPAPGDGGLEVGERPDERVGGGRRGRFGEGDGGEVTIDTGTVAAAERTRTASGEAGRAPVAVGGRAPPARR